MDPRLLGRFGEAEAAEYLRRKGWDIVGMNYRTRLGEVDLIARNRRFVVFVEVKLRRDEPVCPGPEFVTRPKQRRLRRRPKNGSSGTPLACSPGLMWWRSMPRRGRMHPGLPSTMWRTLLN